jgi:aspartate beta-hydroxylase
LRVWGASRDIQIAGLFHSIYSTEAYKRQLVPLNQRASLKEKIGCEGERLAYLFGSLSRRHLFHAAQNAANLRDVTLTIETIENINAGQKTIEVHSGDVASLILLHIANQVEQSDGSAQEPGVWLQHVSSLVCLVHAKSDIRTPLPIPKKLNKCEAAEFRFSYLAACSLLKLDTRRAIDLLRRCLSLCEWLFEPWLLQALAQLKMGDLHLRQQSALKASQLLDAWQVPWDKRLSIDEWKMLAEYITKPDCRRDLPDNVAKVLRKLRQVRQFAHITENSFVFGNTTTFHPLDRFAAYLENISPKGGGQRGGWYPGLISKAIHSSETFPVAEDLERQFNEIRQEVGRLTDHGYHEESENIPRKGVWDVYMLYEQGRKHEANCARLPTISRILESHSCVRKSGGLIYLSRLGPGTVIASHNGPVNFRLRLHLGIQIPSGDCGMKVEGLIKHWAEGKCVVFDDFLEHEVWNRTDEERIVLLLDLWHPNLTRQERRALDTFQWYANNKAQSTLRYWERNRKASIARQILAP